jgi:hypothetical protein
LTRRSKRGIDSLLSEHEGNLEALILSDALVRAIQQGAPEALAWFSEVTGDDLGRLTEVVSRFQTFSHKSVLAPDRNVEAVRGRLIASHDPTTAEILADEWTFLRTQSWLGATTRKVFDAVKAAGGRIRELPSPIARRLIAKTLRKSDLPEHIPLKTLLRAGMKWIGAAGNAVLVLAPPPVSIPVGFALNASVLLLDP